QPIGKRGARVRLEGHGLSAYLYGARPVLVVEFDGTVQTSVTHREARIVETHERGDRYFRFRRNPAARRAVRQRFDSSRERRTNTRSAVGVAQPADLQVRERYEFRQVISAVVESVRLDTQIERPKG